jgi:hypothetical protein
MSSGLSPEPLRLTIEYGMGMDVAIWPVPEPAHPFVQVKPTLP